MVSPSVLSITTPFRRPRTLRAFAGAAPRLMRTSSPRRDLAVDDAQGWKSVNTEGSDKKPRMAPNLST